MKRRFVSPTILLVLVALSLVMAGCAPGTDIEVDTPDTIVLTMPGPNPQLDKPDANGRLAGVAQGLWHGLIAPVTAIGSFFNPAMQMYEVHNNGQEYNLGFLIGIALVFLLLGVLGGRAR
jgi:hypothetical protein